MNNEQIIEALTNFAREHQTRIRIHQGCSLSAQIVGIINNYQHSAERALLDAAAFRDHAVTWIAALRIVADSVAKASTHREKDARLRGLIEVMESASEKLCLMRFEFTTSSTWPDVFRSDFPTRHFVERIRQLEAQVKTYEAEREEIAARNIAAGVSHDQQPVPLQTEDIPF